MALVLGYYNKQNLGDEQYRLSIPIFLTKSGFAGDVTFANPYNITEIPASTKLVVCGGGDIINDWFLTKITNLISKFEGPVIALSVGITYASTITAKYLDKYDHILLRHYAHVAEVGRQIGHANVTSIPDLGFSLPRQPARVFPGRPRIGVFLANGCEVAGVGDVLREYAARGYDVVLYAMNISELAHEGDTFSNAVLGLREAPVIHSVQELLTHIGGLHMAVCLRYHAHIFSIIQGIPFVSLAMTPKVEYLMADYGFRANVARSAAELPAAIDYVLANRAAMCEKIEATRAYAVDVLYRFHIPLTKRTAAAVAAECTAMLAAGTEPEQVVQHALLHTTGTTVNKYTSGFLENVAANTHSMHDMVAWVREDHTRDALATGGLRFFQTARSFGGVHRSGWEAATRALKAVENPKGILCDLYVDATFHWNQTELLAQGVLPYKQLWVGFIHHTQLEDYTPYNAASLFRNHIFLKSLIFCKTLFCLSTYLARYIRAELVRVGAKVRVEVVKHPTETIPTTRGFNIRAWLDTPLITQVGGWLRDPYAIYEVKLPWGRKQALEGAQMKSYVHPEVYHICNVLNCSRNSGTGIPDEPEGCGMAGSCCRPPVHIARTTVMTKYMTRYIARQGAPSFAVVRVGPPCCDSAVEWPANWAARIAIIETKLRINYESVTRISTLSNQDYDALLSRSVVFLNLLDCSAANTIVECMMRNTPVIVNSLPAVQEYLGPLYPGYYASLDSAWRLITPSKVLEMYMNLKKQDKHVIMLDQFVKRVEQISSII
jgi:hypothetical protein